MPSSAYRRSHNIKTPGIKSGRKLNVFHKGQRVSASALTGSRKAIPPQDLGAALKNIAKKKKIDAALKKAKTDATAREALKEKA